MKVAVLGEALIDFLVGQDGAYRPHLGGSPYNVAISLARQGVGVSYLSKLSDDAFGEQLFQSLAIEGVVLPNAVRSRWPTSLAMVTVDAKGQPSYRLYREGIADKDTSLEEIVDSVDDQISVFHTGSLAITPSQLDKIKQVFMRLKDRGVLISIDINIRLGASLNQAAYLGGVRSLLPFADIVKASDEDLEAFDLGVPRTEVAAIFHSEMQGGLFVLTEGTGGALLRSSDIEIRKRAYPVVSIVDTVGAGDTFHSSFLAELLRDSPTRIDLARLSNQRLGDALEFACAAAAINVGRAGCSPPTANEVRDYIIATSR